MKITLPNVRLAFPVLFEPKTVNGEGEPAFSATFLLDPVAHKTTIGQINDAAETLGREKWGAKWAAVKKEIAAKDRMPLHDGDAKSSYAGFEGALYINARNKTRPLVIDRDKSPLQQSDGRPYAGCYVNTSIELWVQDNAYGKRINASLRGVQFYRDGEAFAGGGAASEDEFEDLGVDEEAPV